MPSDLITRLRARAEAAKKEQTWDGGELETAAADEVARLRAELDAALAKIGGE